MVRAILSGAKTQTRRVVKPQPTVDVGGGYWYPGPADPARAKDNRNRRHYGNLKHLRQGLPLDFSPYGQPGDRLWVRETHAQFAVGNRTGIAPQCVAYRVTCYADGGFDYVNNGDEVMRLKVTKWTPAIFMPRWASRITLEITEIRVERLHHISAENVAAEGTPGMVCGRYQCGPCNGRGKNVTWPSGCPHCGGTGDNPRPYFQRLWDSINGAHRGCAWADSPWVWVVAFRRIAA